MTCWKQFKTKKDPKKHDNCTKHLTNEEVAHWHYTGLIAGIKGVAVIDFVYNHHPLVLNEWKKTHPTSSMTNDAVWNREKFFQTEKMQKLSQKRAQQGWQLSTEISGRPADATRAVFISTLPDFQRRFHFLILCY